MTRVAASSISLRILAHTRARVNPSNETFVDNMNEGRCDGQ